VPPQYWRYLHALDCGGGMCAGCGGDAAERSQPFFRKVKAAISGVGGGGGGGASEEEQEEEDDGDNNETVVVFVNGERKTRIPAMLPIGSARKLMLRDYRGVMERCGPDSKQARAMAALRDAKAALLEQAQAQERLICGMLRAMQRTEHARTRHLRQMRAASQRKAARRSQKQWRDVRTETVARLLKQAQHRCPLAPRRPYAPFVPAETRAALEAAWLEERCAALRPRLASDAAYFGTRASRAEEQAAREAQRRQWQGGARGAGGCDPPRSGGNGAFSAVLDHPPVLGQTATVTFDVRPAAGAGGGDGRSRGDHLALTVLWEKDGRPLPELEAEQAAALRREAGREGESLAEAEAHNMRTSARIVGRQHHEAVQRREQLSSSSGGGGSGGGGGERGGGAPDERAAVPGPSTELEQRLRRAPRLESSLRFVPAALAPEPRDGALSRVTLLIRNFAREDEGVYRVRLANRHGEFVTPERPLVLGEPPTFFREAAHQTVKVGEAAMFWPLVLGTPGIAYEWFFEGTTGAAPLKIACTSNLLSIACVAESNVGQYTVVARNGAGEARCSALLALEDEELHKHKRLLAWKD
jgi:hypothetical protein